MNHEHEKFLISGEIRGHGNIDDAPPEFIISVLPELRGQGIGFNLMEEMLMMLQAKEYKRASLFVQKSNPACSWYQCLGFQTVQGNGEDLVMQYVLDSV